MLIGKSEAQKAPDFALDSTEGREIRLTDFQGKHHLVLVFNRGFM